jgi:hypothetical protein
MWMRLNVDALEIFGKGLRCPSLEVFGKAHEVSKALGVFGKSV